MDFARLLVDDPTYGNYFYSDSTSEALCVLGLFFSEEIGPNGRNFFRDWANTSVNGDIIRGNCTIFENEQGSILLSDEWPVIPNPTKLKMTIKQFVQLCDDWQEKVVKRKPKKVIIKHEHGEFYIETSN